MAAAALSLTVGRTRVMARRWHPGHVGLIFRLAELLIVLVPLAGVIFAGFRAFQRYAQSPDRTPTPYDDVAGAPADRTTTTLAAQWRAITRTASLRGTEGKPSYTSSTSSDSAGNQPAQSAHLVYQLRPTARSLAPRHAGETHKVKHRLCGS